MIRTVRHLNIEDIHALFVMEHINDIGEFMNFVKSAAEHGFMLYFYKSSNKIPELFLNPMLYSIIDSIPAADTARGHSSHSKEERYVYALCLEIGG